jgi:hypothetical protein
MRRWTVGKVLLLVFGSIVALIGLAVAAGGGFLLYANGALKDDQGFFTSRTERFATSSAAIATKDLDVANAGPVNDSGRFATIRIRVRPADPSRAVFVGIGPVAQVNRYLQGVAHVQLTDLDFDPFKATYEPKPGTPRAPPPGVQPFWAARAGGRGQQDLVWGVKDGTWSVVLMNADGGPAVDGRASVGVKIQHLVPIAVGLLIGGLLIAGGGALMIYFGGRTPRRSPVPPETTTTTEAP